MKNTVKLCIYLVLICHLSWSFAQETYKLGAVNAALIFEQSPEREVARQIIEKEFSPRDKQLSLDQKKLKEQEDKLQKDGTIMSSEELRKLERDILSNKRELKRSQEEFREDLNFRRNEEFTKIQKRVIEAIQKVAIENNYDLVLSDGVIYASPRTDISNLVIEYLNKDSKDSKDSKDE